MGMIVRNEKTYTGISSASLSTLTDVALETPVNGQGLVYDEELQKWVNRDVTSGGATTGTLKPWLYSEEETVIGNYMGKPLYRKIILISGEVNLTKSGSIYYKIYTMEELGLETGEIINVKGTIMRAQSGYETTKYTFPFTDTYNKESVMSLYFFPTSLKIESEIDQSKSGIIFSDPIFTVEYIKESDEEGSGDSLMPYGPVGNTQVNYSTEEQVIGTWIDGRPIYQKTITDYDILNTTNRTVLIAENLDFLTSLPTGVATIINAFDGSVDKSVLPRIAKYVDYQLGIYATPEGYIVIDLGDSINSSNYSSVIATITFQYTKTTN
jgi:hypothetical protein